MNYSEETFYKRHMMEIRSIVFVICIIFVLSIVTIIHYQAESNKYSFMVPATVKDLQEKNDKYEMVLELNDGDESNEVTIPISQYEYMHYKVGDRLTYNTDTNYIVNYED